MMPDLGYMRRCLALARGILQKLQTLPHGGEEADIYRLAAVKLFEIVEEHAENLIKLRLQEDSGDSGINRLSYKAALMRATQLGILPERLTTRWLEYRATRNATAHEYGMHYADEAIKLLPRFIGDAAQFLDAMQKTP